MIEQGYCAMHSGMLSMGYGWIFQLIIFVIFFLVVWWLLKNNSLKTVPQKQETPMEILKRRLASGEITKKEFETLKKEIDN